MAKKQPKLTDLEHYQTHDPAKGSFIVEQERLPLRDRDTNPKGVKHPFKTDQDYLPKDKRPRVQAWQRRLDKMRNAA